MYALQALLLLLTPCKSFYLNNLNTVATNVTSSRKSLMSTAFVSSYLTLKEQSNDSDIQTTKTTAEEEEEAVPNALDNYPTAGGMYDISEGPGHHLINVDHDKLHDLEEIKSVNVHEVEVDAVTVTFVSFITVALFLITLAFVEDGNKEGLNSLIARIQNFMS